MNITVEDLLELFTGPTTVAIYDLNIDEEVFKGYHDEVPSEYGSLQVQSIDPIDSTGDRAGLICLNVDTEDE